ncbi:GPI inositol-deacylase PGAP1-like protein [Heracleum sosnowskyi]|uniref:GPI inositol-deacylase PGAP1-like protein n=1 Tax=Heracleum sosnowskyi TaxID=360622 RepID=A0AAD8M549_9APIA|nr:GPI inositol-deacylase PGAP1-like protein [Heracleum sosnowskyi]
MDFKNALVNCSKPALTSRTIIISSADMYSSAMSSVNRLMGYTENKSATYLSSGNPCVDFFYHAVPDTPQSQLVKLLEVSWDHDSLITLKLICNLRGVRGTCKSDKEGFFTAALWLYDNHPKTLACNAHVIALFGCFKDLVEILFRIVHGHDARSRLKKEWLDRKAFRSGKRARRRKMVYCYVTRRLKKKRDSRATLMKKQRMRAEVPREKRIEANNAKLMREKQRARVLRKKKQLALSKQVQELYVTDANYRLLHEKISTFFADLLKADMDCLNSGKLKNISLAGKWCPTIDSSYDKHTLICASIARKIFSRDCYPEYEGIEEAKYIYRVRDRLRKQVLVPLHKALKLPEVYMSTRNWKLLPYNRVASVAMKTYTDIFVARDNERFKKYLKDVEKGKKKIAAGALFPHDITRSCVLGSDVEQTVGELQWKRMVDDMLQRGKLVNCIAVCDVSGSMKGTPMAVAIALGLLVSELSEEPWKGQVITFSQNPQLHLIEGDTVQEKTQFIRFMEWGMNTDFQKVFDRILEVAVAAKLSEEQMIKRLFVFSDMEFDQASLNPWETDYQVIQKKFRKNGYEKVPEIVFWNLRNSSATPVQATQNGVALLSGYSKNLMNIFLEGGGIISPENVMEAAVSGSEYQQLVVYD